MPAHPRSSGLRFWLTALLAGAQLCWASTDAMAQSSGQAPQVPPPVRRTPDAPAWPTDFEVGLEGARIFADYFGVVETDSLLQRVNRIGYQVASQTGQPDYLFTFQILDTPDANAMALPGGFIFITRGILEQGLSDHALAHLFGHELGHVTERHFARSNRVETLLSLIQTAAMVAALVAVPSSPSGGYDYDEHEQAYRRSVGGKEAAFQGTSIFGSLFSELLSRGYARGLELEADEIGRRFAGRAGHPMSGGVELMSTLRGRIYEDQQFGYWSTHPYFDERLQKASAALDAGGSRPHPSEVQEYREQTQARLAQLAETVIDDDVAMFLYRCALRANPSGPRTIPVAHQLLARRAQIENRKKDILRSITPIVAGYDSLLTLAQTEMVTDSERRRLVSERDRLLEERQALYARSVAIVDSPGAGVQFLELFLENYPEDPRRREIVMRLAEQYRLADRPDRAALTLNRLVGEVWGESSPAIELVSQETPAKENNSWRARSVEALRRTVPETTELTTNQRILDTSPSDSVRHWARTRLFELAADFDSLELGSRYLAKYPDSEAADAVRAQIEALAQKRVLQGRLHESLARYQEALDQYNEVILLAPGSKAAATARAGIERVHQLSGR